MRGMEAASSTPKAHIRQILNSTTVKDLKKVEDYCITHQILIYEQMQEFVDGIQPNSTPQDRETANFFNEYLSADPYAVKNGPHVKEVIATTKRYQNSIRKTLLAIDPTLTPSELDHLIQYFVTSDSAHDLGKTFPSKIVLDVAKQAEQTGHDPYLIGRVALHEISSAVYIEYIGESLGIDPRTTGSLIRNILGHNDGSGLRQVYWNQIAHDANLLGDYPFPETLPAKFLTLADRGAQATLGPTGGVMKISAQRLRTEKWGKEHLRQAMEVNAQNTILQMRIIIESIGYGMDQTEMAIELIQAQERTLDAYHSIHWESETSGTIADSHFSNASEFFHIVNDMEFHLETPGMPQDYWKRQRAKNEGK